MRKLLALIAILSAFLLVATPAPAFWPHRPHPWFHGGAYYGQAVQPQGAFGNLALALLPGLLNQIHLQLPGGLQIGGGGDPSQIGVPADATRRLQDLNKRLDDTRQKSQELLDKISPPVTKGRDSK